MNRGDFFKSVVQWEFPMKDFDREGKLPVFYYDNTAMTAIYTASADKIRSHLPIPEMHPAEVTPGRALVSFTAFEYRRTDIDPYNEFSISFPITFGKISIPGITMLSQLLRRYFTVYVWQLPVTTEIARKGGVELYGYPKFIAGIDFTQEGSLLACTLSENGEKILTIKGKQIRTSPEKVLRFKTYSVKGGTPLVSNIYMNPIEFGQSMSKDSAELSLGENHPVARQLKDMELSDKPLFYQYIPANELILYGPRNLMDD